MGIQDRRNREKEEIKSKIIQGALDILITQGYQALSVRKIAGKIEYSTGVIYHYFKDKEEILQGIAQEGYQRILFRISQTPYDPRLPIQGIKAFFQTYFEMMLENRPWAKIALLSDIPGVLEKAVILERGISFRSETFRIMTARLSEAKDQGLIKVLDVELTAQILWTTFYGLLARLLLEKDTPKDQQDRLIQEVFRLIDRYLSP